VLRRTDIQLLIEAYNNLDMKAWRKALQKDIIKLGKSEDGTGGNLSQTLWTTIRNEIKSANGYSKLYRFHELEYKLHLLQTKYNDARLIDFTKHELLTLFDWLKEYMLGILDTRVLYDFYDSPEKYNNFLSQSYEQYSEDSFNEEPDPNERIEGGVPWESISRSYYMLNHANTLSDKIKAVTLSLNAWHDHGGIFGIGSFHEEDPMVWTFAPLSIEQYDSLGSINANKVEREIKKELG
jgi:hypothetical protein